MIGFISSKSKRAEEGREPVNQMLLINRYDPERAANQDMLQLSDITEVRVRLELRIGLGLGTCFKVGQWRWGARSGERARAWRANASSVPPLARLWPASREGDGPHCSAFSVRRLGSVRRPGGPMGPNAPTTRCPPSHAGRRCSSWAFTSSASSPSPRRCSRPPTSGRCGPRPAAEKE